MLDAGPLFWPPRIGNMLGPTARRNQHDIEPYIMHIETWVVGEEPLRRAFQPFALARMNGLNRFAFRSARLDFHQRHRLSARNNDVDFAERRFVARSDNAIALYPQGKAAQRLGGK